MHSIVIIELDKNIDYWQFLREKPTWYRELSRHPERIEDFVKDYKIVRRKRVVDKVEDFSKLINYCKSDISIVDFTDNKEKIEYLIPKTSKEKLKVYVSEKVIDNEE